MAEASGQLVNFSRAYLRTNEFEGPSGPRGHVKDLDDPGGETYRGISRVAHPFWKGWAYVELEDWWHADQAHAEFFRAYYWSALGIAELPADLQPLADEIYDSAVNFGRHRSAEWLQRALVAMGEVIAIDARIGPRTRAAAVQVWTDRSDVLLKALNSQQGARYIEIAVARPRSRKYITGWFRRVEL